MTLTANDQERIYRDRGGWAVVVPPGWHVVPFTEEYDAITTAGVQLSNVPLPPPSVIPGYPLQVKGQLLPAHGIGVTIAANADSHPSSIPVTALPLRWPQGWLRSTAPLGSTHRASVSFRVGDRLFTVSVTFGPEALGPKADHVDLQAFAAAIHSIRQARDTDLPAREIL